MLISSQTLYQLEEELHVQIVPGTEIMTDVGSHHFVKSSDRVLVPQPSGDPHDPLVSLSLFEMDWFDVLGAPTELRWCRIGVHSGNSLP